jgi:hypothetical protein
MSKQQGKQALLRIQQKFASLGLGGRNPTLIGKDYKPIQALKLRTDLATFFAAHMRVDTLESNSLNSLKKRKEYLGSSIARQGIQPGYQSWRLRGSTLAYWLNKMPS